MDSTQTAQKLKLLADSFKRFLYEDDETFLEGMKGRNLAGDDISRYQHWEWTQGVGLYGFYKLYRKTGDESYLSLLTSYYEKEVGLGLPAANVNTVTPLLTLSMLLKDSAGGDAALAGFDSDGRYLSVCKDWAGRIMHDFPRTREDGIQHITSDTLNEEELWDDTLMMTVLFLANMAEICDNDEWRQEAAYQFLLHIRYLSDPVSGLWYHGWTFLGRNNFAGAFWGRGNSWYTVAVPEYLEIATSLPSPVKRMIVNSLAAQAEALERFQDPSGMWHTLIDDETSYVETSATCGFAYGLLRASRTGLIDSRYSKVALRALDPILSYISEDGTVGQVSYGTPMGRESKDFYKKIPIKPMPYGQALAMLFLAEAGEV